jgi:SAM-dependent methyltransferase
MARRRALVVGGILAALGAMLFRSRKAVGGGAAYWVRQWRSPSPCPYSASWMLDLPRPWLTVPRLLDILGPAPGERLLEVGAGTGAYTLPMARAVAPGGTVDAFDVQQEMLDELTRRADRQGVSNVRPQQGDAQRLPYADASFDAAYLVTVLHEVPDQDRALRELCRVVRPGGRVVVGEMSPLPTAHFVRLPLLEPRAAAAGFRFERRLGPSLLWYARFSRMPE